MRRPAKLCIMKQILKALNDVHNLQAFNHYAIQQRALVFFLFNSLILRSQLRVYIHLIRLISYLPFQLNNFNCIQVFASDSIAPKSMCKA